MPYSSPELLQLQAVQDWLATLATWSTWVGSSDPTVLKSRVVWPLQAAPALPVCVLNIVNSTFANFTGSAGGANFQPHGQIKFCLFAADTNPPNIQAGYSDFLDMVGQLRSEMVDNAHAAPVWFNKFSLSGNPVVLHSSWINGLDAETDEGLAAYFVAEITVDWGPDQ